MPGGEDAGLTGRVALTFDDGPDPVWTPRVLDALDEAGARATFFIVAPLALAYPSVVRRMADEGHEIGLHCHRHVRHDRMSLAQIRADATNGLEVLGGLGQRVRDWRTPWGVVTEGTADVAESVRLRLVGWTADSGDWRGTSAKAMLDRMSPGIEDRAIVLMHDSVGPGASRSGCGETVDLVAPLVDLVRFRGLEPVPVGRLAGRIPDRNPGSVSAV